MKKIGLRILGISFMLALIENAYFGWNMVPMSQAEWILDIIIGSGLGIGYSIYVIGWTISKTK